MVESRWLRWFGPGLLAVVAVGLIGSTTIGAGTRVTSMPRDWAPRACTGTPEERSAAARDAVPVGPADLRAAPWFRLDPVAGDDGSLRGQRLVLGRVGDPVARTLDLSAESFAAGPFGRIVLVGSDDGSTSRLAADRPRSVAAPGRSARSATSSGGRPSTRPAHSRLRDARRPSDADRPRHLAAPGRRDRAGRSGACADRPRRPIRAHLLDRVHLGRHRATASRSSRVARYRLPDAGPRPGRRSRCALLDAPDLGLLVGLDGDRVVTYAELPRPPLPDRLDRPHDRPSTIARERGRLRDARPDARRDAPGRTRRVRLRHRRFARSISREARRSISPRSRTGTASPDHRVDRWRGDPAACRAGSLLAPDGRLSIDPSDHRPQLRHIPDGATVPLDEAIR